MKTAVEWLIEQLENHNGVTRTGFEKCIEHAKEMEKEQIYKALIQGNKDCNAFTTTNKCEEYYKETYKNTEQ